MKREVFVRLAFFVTFTVLCLTFVIFWVTPSKSRHESPKNQQPNILIIFADDIGTNDVPGYWRKTNDVQMPNLEEFVSKGTTFTDAHSTPLCAPSRYTLLSGNYPHRGQKDSCVWSLNYETSQFVPGQQSIAQVLNDNGYQTAMFGKWHLGGIIPTIQEFDPPVSWLVGEEKTNVLTSTNHNWTEPIKQGPTDIGFNHSYITAGGIQNPPYAFLRDGMVEQESLENVRMWNKGSYGMPHGVSKIKAKGEGSRSWDSSAYNMILVNETEHFLDRHLTETQGEVPFFTYVALGSVHVPHSPPYTYLDGSPISGVYDHEHFDMLLEMDKVIGSFLQMLENRGLLQNTIVIFSSDNGGIKRENIFDSSGPLQGSKGSLYEGGHRIPMTIRWDDGNIPRGETRSEIVALNDIYATLCELTGIDVPSGQAMDSISFANYLQEERHADTSREEFGVWRYKGTKFDGEALRKGEMKLIHNVVDDVFELFNLTEDLSETNDIAAENEELAEEMYTILREIGPIVHNTNS